MGHHLQDLLTGIWSLNELLGENPKPEDIIENLVNRGHHVHHVDGTPLQQENKTVVKGVSHVWETRTLKTMHKFYMKTSPNASAFYYIRWENLTICHSYEDIQSGFGGTILWNPESAQVQFKKRTVRVIPPSGNANISPEQNRNVKDAKLRFFYAGEASPVNCSVFEDLSLVGEWNVWKLITDPSKKQWLPFRAIFYGLCKEGIQAIEYWDPAIHEKDIGENQFYTIPWNHNLHIDSPPRYLDEIFINDLSAYISTHSNDLESGTSAIQILPFNTVTTYLWVQLGAEKLKIYQMFDYFWDMKQLQKYCFTVFVKPKVYI